MNKEQLAHKIVELRERVFALQKEIDETEREICAMKEPEEWPEAGDWYHCINLNGEICYSQWDGGEIDKARLAIGNVFRMKADAEFAVERLKVLAEMRKFTSDGGEYVMYYSGAFSIEKYNAAKDYDIMRFDNVYAINECVHSIGKERLKKYYFGVSD